MVLTSVRGGVRKASIAVVDGCKKVSTAVMTSCKNFDVQRGQPIVEITSAKRVFSACALVDILFFLWGLAYGLLDIMNYHIREIMGISRESASLMAMAYYAAYAWAPMFLAGTLIQKCGYRHSFVLGLVVLAAGSFLFAGSAHIENFACMVLSMHAIGVGVSTLERSANPYVTNCGPKGTRALRILTAQSMAAVGTLVAPQVAKLALGYTESNEDTTQCILGIGRVSLPSKEKDLGEVISLYIYIGAGIFGLAVFAAVCLFRTWVVPEMPQEISPKSDCGVKFWKHQIFSKNYIRLWLGFGANFFNMACQVMIAQFLIEHLMINACASTGEAANYFTYSQTAFLVGRLIPAVLVFWPKIFKPRYVLAVFIFVVVVAPAVNAFVLGPAAIIASATIMFFEAPSFPMIFESATVGLNKWSSLGESVMTMSIMGGGFGPIMMGALVTRAGISKSWLLTTACFFVVFMYALANNLVPSFRRTLDASEAVEAETDLEYNDTGASAVPANR